MFVLINASFIQKYEQMNVKLSLKFKRHYCTIVTVMIAIFCNEIAFAQNMYSLSGWTVGTGNTTDFYKYGVESSNSRELGFNHLGEQVVLWKATPNPSSFADGGIYAAHKPIDRTKTYRLSIWIKKTNSFSGRTYFGCHSYSDGTHHTLNMNGTANANPYFWYGDLPELDKWYLLVGYVHPTSYNGPSLGKVYDGETGEEVMSINDIKFNSTSVNLRLRAFFAYDTNLDDRQYLYKPIMEEYTNASPSINSLLSINEYSTIMFDYDAAGNQIKRHYCESGTSCSFPSRLSNPEPIKEEIDLLEKHNEEEVISDEITFYPNPTSGIITLQGSKEIVTLTDLIMVYDSRGVLIQKIIPKNNLNRVQIDISNQSSGLYFIHMHLKTGEDISKKIIKK